jgi:hypothetical protein
MATGVQVTFDCADPAALGQFWAAVLGYVEQSPPPGFGVPPDHRDTRYAIVDPDGVRPRFFFQDAIDAKVGELGESWVVLRDPEGNEFCLQ